MGAADPIRPVGARRTSDPLGPVLRVQPVRRRGRADAEDEERPRDEDPGEGAERDPGDSGGPHIDVRA